ncbi:hypothetical protein L484_020118 [Morus notabilis]|uniref:Uncharacterized protein n=1 Tax=Morus notabilis TaxID=981085 RepID=W9RJJ0_9ROSA|nr:hypothetical protein L484_020118 [Morus notabilis]
MSVAQWWSALGVVFRSMDGIFWRWCGLIPARIMKPLFAGGILVSNNGGFYPILLVFVLVWWSGILPGCRPLRFTREITEIVGVEFVSTEVWAVTGSEAFKRKSFRNCNKDRGFPIQLVCGLVLDYGYRFKAVVWLDLVW